MRVFLLVIVACVLAAPASAKAPPFWWWTTDQAETAVKKIKPRTIDGKRLPLVSADCSGYPRARAYQAATFRLFKCFLVFQKPDGRRTYDQIRSFWIRTSTSRRGRIACWLWSQDGGELAARCP